MLGVTVYFPIDVQSMPAKPFHRDTPFGRAQIIGAGNVFEQRDALEEENRILRAKLEQFEGET